MKSQTSSLERNSFSSLEDELGPTTFREKIAQTKDESGKLAKTSAAQMSKRNKNNKGRQKR